MKLKRNEKEAFAVAKASWLGLLIPEQITLHKLLKKLVPIKLTDHAAGIVVIRDISGIFRQQIADDLIDRIITFFVQSIEDTPENTMHILFVVAGYCKLNGIFRHDFNLL
jgi:hypothetical protein